MIERAKIQSLIDSLRGNGRIDHNFFDELDKSFDSQTLHIGVVGKMKAGKSSLVNAAIFGSEALPTGPDPVTVTLTEVSYGEKDEVVVELLSESDIAELKEKAAYNGDDLILQTKAKAAKEVLKSLTPDYESYIGSTKTINLSELSKFVDADGELSGLAKTVKIKLNNENLKGVTIIDTPGFNDPITSRGDTTKNALNKCHVLLFVHNKDGYDSTDVSLLTEQIEYAGISEIVDILNKVDLLQDDISKWPKELAYFIEKRNSLQIEKDSIKELLNNSRATFTSSAMALCGLIPIEEMGEDMKYQYSCFEEDFEILGKYTDKEEQRKAFVQHSNITSIIDEINRLAKDGSTYLVNGPLMTLKGKLSSVEEVINSEIEAKEAKLRSLNVGIDKDKKSLDGFEDFMISVMKKVKNSLIESELNELIRQTIREVQSLRESEASREFSEEKYPEPTIITAGVTKANIANFNTFMQGFENSFRDALHTLRDNFVNSCKKEINTLILGLANTSEIGKERIDDLKASLINSLVKILDEIIVVVPAFSLSTIPDGKQKQWDKLRSAFLNHYDDKKLCNMVDGPLASFKQNVESLGYVNVAIRELDTLRNDIIDSMNKSPMEKQQEKSKIMEEINELNEELKSIRKSIKSIDELKNSI